MSEISISFKNYKLLKEGEFNLSNGTIFFVQGPNNVGKTSFLNLLRSIMEVKDETVNPVTFGEKEGFATGSITGADGNTYQFRYDFNVDGKNKFQFIDQNNKVIKSITEMRAIFNYVHFTAEEFFDWSKTVPGRKKQRDIFMQLLTAKEKVDIEEIDGKVNPINGELVESRKNLNKEVDFLKKRIDATIITPDMQKLYDSRVEIKKLYDTLVDESKIIEQELYSVDLYRSQYDNAVQALADHEKTSRETLNNKSAEIDEIQEEIAKLQAKLKVKQTEFDEYGNSSQKKIKELNAVIGERAKLFDVELVKAKTTKLQGIEERITAGKTKIEELNKVKALIENKAVEKEEYEQKLKKVDEYDEQINTLREKKKDIIFRSQNIPAGWSLDDDSITVDGIPFMETDISKSKAMKAIANLMMKVNQSPIMLMGDAESLGYDVLNELEQHAKENGKVMIFAEHMRASEELKLVCYDEIDKPVKKESKDLF